MASNAQQSDAAPSAIIPMAVLRRNRSATAASSTIQLSTSALPPAPSQQHHHHHHQQATASVPLLHTHPTSRTSSSSMHHQPTPPPAARLPTSPPTTSLLKRLALSTFRLLVWLLIITCALATATDLYLQALKKPYTASIFLQLFIIGSYALLAVASLLFAISRFMTVRYALARLPKMYIPITPADGLPRHVQRHVAAKLDRSTRLVNEAKPDGLAPVADREWGEPGTPLEGVNFRTATLTSVQVLVQHVRTGGWPHLVPRTSEFALRRWLRTLVDARVVDKRVARLYADLVEAARWGDEPITVERYLQAMKVLAVMMAPTGQAAAAPRFSMGSSSETAAAAAGADVSALLKDRADK
ncbi:hypothetical protein BCR44DRAFT_24473, partial [Catenaria anguillulae PL171]